MDTGRSFCFFIGRRKSCRGQRAHAARAIGELKRNSDLPVYEPQREQQVFDHVRAANKGPLAEAEMLHVYERIMDVMRTLQRRDQ